MLSCLGFQSHRAIRFSLNLTLYGNIIASKSYYARDAVGGMIVNLTKAEKSIWPRLATDGKKVSVWWKVVDEFKEEMDKYFAIIDSEDDEEERKY